MTKLRSHPVSLVNSKRRSASSCGSGLTTAVSRSGHHEIPFGFQGGLANRISVCLCVTMIEHDIFRALADPTRRTIFEKLANGSMNATTLRQGMDISQPAMSQHLAVLRAARLVREQKEGRFMNYEVDPDGLALIAQWLAKYRAYWPARIDALKLLLKDMDQ